MTSKNRLTTAPSQLLSPSRAFLFTLYLNLTVSATPLRFIERSLIPRDDSSKSSLPAGFWTPGVIIFVIFVGLAALGCLGRSLLRRSRMARTTGATANRPQIVTADQLAPSVNPAAANSANPARRPRRPRRPRRTPSQISVTSLPEYMKEPGAEEVVIFRGPEGARQMPQPAETAAADHTSDEEQGEDASGNSRSRQARTQEAGSGEWYVRMPASPTSTPLLQEHQRERSMADGGRQEDPGSGTSADDDNNGGISMQQLPRRISVSRPSLQSGTTGEINSLRRFDSNNTQASVPLAHAPPAYFEVIGDDEPLGAYYPPHSSSTIASSASTNAPLLGSSLLPPTSTSAHTPAHRNRQSGFRTFLNRMSISMPIGGGGSGSVPQQQQQHQRSRSGNSVATNSPAPARPSSSFARRPRSSHSANQSITSLTSPSMISLNSISAPLTHTASRTKFTFPSSRATGLPTITPEQARIIASRDAIGRFGMPYGPDAEAFAASELQLQPPPPGFGDLVGEVSGSSTAAAGEVPLEEVEVGDERGLTREPTVRFREPTGSAIVSSDTLPEDRRDEPSQSSSQRPNPQRRESQESILKSNPTLAPPPQPSSSTAPSASPSPSSLPSLNGRTTASTPPVSEFGQIRLPPTSKLMPPDDNLLRSDSLSSVYTSRTYATAAESLLSGSSSNLSLNARLRSGSADPLEG